MHEQAERHVIPKRHRKWFFGEIEFNFTSPFTPEECVYNLQHSSEDISAHVIQEDENTYSFYIGWKREYESEASGQLKLWHGTSTLITGRARLGFLSTIVILVWLVFSILLGSLNIISPVVSPEAKLLVSTFMLLFVTVPLFMLLAQMNALVDQIENAVAVKRNLPEKRLKKKKRRD